MFPAAVKAAGARTQPPRPSVDGWTTRRRHLHSMARHSATRRKEILPFATTGERGDQEGVVLSEVSQAVGDKCHAISLVCGMKQTNSKRINKTNRLTDAEQTDARREGLGRGGEGGGVECASAGPEQSRGAEHVAKNVWCQAGTRHVGATS